MSSLSSIWDWFAQAIWYIITFIGGVVTVVLSEVLMDYLKKPKFIIETIHKGDKLGFNVRVKKRTVKDARIRCNNIDYFWENGNKIERKDLYVGDNPSSFYPFQVTVEYAEDVSNYPRWVSSDKEYEKGGVLLTVREITTQKTVYVEAFPIPKGVTIMWFYSHYTEKPLFNASIRLIGEGIEEERDYSLWVGLNNLVVPAIREGKPIMDYINYGFEVKKKK
jgi:hypothetical protein